VREFLTFAVVSLAVALCWIGIWDRVLRAFGIPLFGRTPEERATRRERIVRMGKFRYIVMFGVLGFGFAFGIGMVGYDLLRFGMSDLFSKLGKFLVLSVLWGWLHAASEWNESFSDKDQFPPHYPPLNQ